MDDGFMHLAELNYSSAHQGLPERVILRGKGHRVRDGPGPPVPGEPKLRRLLPSCEFQTQFRGGVRVSLQHGHNL